jgi:superfamily II DNA or RNA helicase
LQRTLNFYRLACTPQYEKDKKTPLLEGYQGTMVDAGSHKLTELRNRMPEAGGLVIAPSIELAEYFVELIERLEGDRPILVHSKMQNADSKIDAFRKSDKRWLVSVAMVSEGVDIPRLRVLVYLSSALTELAFRQAIGRVVRTYGPDDDTAAYAVIPSFDLLENYARRVENEMSATAKAKIERQQKKTKICPACRTECELDATTCVNCGHEFPAKVTKTKPCPACGAANPLSAKRCINCDRSFMAEFHLTLEEALRTGVIVRGMDIEEAEAREGEAMAAAVRAKALESGDENIIRVLRALPEQSWSRLKNILDK